MSYIFPYSALTALYQLSISGARVFVKRSCAPLRLLWISDNPGQAEWLPCPRKQNCQIRAAQHDHVNHVGNVSESICHTDRKLDLVVYCFNPCVGQTAFERCQDSLIVAAYLPLEFHESRNPAMLRPFNPVVELFLSGILVQPEYGTQLFFQFVGAPQAVVCFCNQLQLCLLVCGNWSRQCRFFQARQSGFSDRCPDRHGCGHNTMFRAVDTVGIRTEFHLVQSNICGSPQAVSPAGIPKFAPLQFNIPLTPVILLQMFLPYHRQIYLKIDLYDNPPKVSRNS